MSSEYFPLSVGLKKFWKNWKLFIILFIVALGMAASVILDARGRDEDLAVTEGLTPEEVVRLYYNAVNAPDLYVIRNCVDPLKVNALNNRIFSAGYGETFTRIEEYTHAINLNVTDGEVLRITPADWITGGSRVLGPDTVVFGINNLSITPLGADRFRVAYEFYSTDLYNTVSELRPDIESCTDVCSLAFRNGRWIITGIDQGREL